MRLTRLTSALVTISLLSSASPVFATRYTNDPISYVKDRGIMDGYDNGSFGEHNLVNRAEFAKIITNIDTNSLSSYRNSLPFRDTSKTAWYARYVQYVYEKGFMSGYSDNTFRPDRNITLAEAAKVLAMAFDISTSKSGDWYDGYIRALADRHAIPTSIGSIDDPLTRGEVADMVYRLDTNTRSLSSRTYSDVVDGRYGNSSNRSSGRYCYYDLENRYFCDDTRDYNYDTYYQDANHCYYDRNNRYQCDDTNDDCYYDSNNRYRCDDNYNDNNDCYYDSNHRYRCGTNYNDSDCSYDSNNRYRCNDDNDGDCVYDSDGRRVCGTATDSGDNCYYDSNNRYRCDNNDYNNNYDDCYYDSNNRYRCDNDYNDHSYDDNGDCVYDSDGRRVCGTSHTNNSCYYDSNHRYRCDDDYNDNNDCYYDSHNNYYCN